MVGTKRKATAAGGGKRPTPKKQKTELAKSKPKIPPPDLEVETDSDPIIETDTTEHSGEDDGASWPSDNDAGSGDQFSGTENPAPLADKAVNVEENASKSRESHAKQKAATQERKAAKPNADVIARSKKIWERLRRQSHVPRDERKKLVAELFDILTGRVKDFTLKHDASRVVQTALKYGNLEQRKMIARELKGEYCHLAEGKYAKFTIGKILSNGDDEIRDIVIPEFFGNVRRLIKHPEASWILDDIYRGAATKRQKAQLLREWYGAEYAIFKAGMDGQDTADLRDLLSANPEKRSHVMKYLFQMIDQLVQKKTCGFTILHDAMLQYFLNIIPGSEEATDYIELLKGDEEGDLMKNLAFTPSGARLVSLAFAYSSAKDRKLLLRTYKGVIETMMFDANAKRVLISALDVIDDTVLTSKSIYGEIVPKELKDSGLDKLLEFVMDASARAVLLFPFGANLRSLLVPGDITLLREVHDIRSQTSKKDPSLRSREVARYLSPSLITLIAGRAEILVQSSFGCRFIQDVILGAEGDKSAALQAILSLVEREDMQNTLLTPHVGRMLKALALSGRYNPESKSVELIEPPLGFADMIWSKISDDTLNWAVGPNSSVVVGLLESQNFNGKDDLKQRLKENRKQLQKAANEGPGVKDSSAKLQANTGKKRQKHGKSAEDGNQGTRLLLKILDT